VALVPVASYAEGGDWEVVPDIGIACRGAVETVIVVSKVPWDQITRIYLDDASRTSSMLLKLLLAAEGRHPELLTVAHGVGGGVVGQDEAALIIGDAAFSEKGRFPFVYDLGQRWFERTGLPMVFAFWAARKGALQPEHIEALWKARDWGIAHAEQLARAYRDSRLQSGQSALAENDYANYLRRSIRYRLDAYEREGLIEFLARANKAGLTVIDDHVAFADRPGESGKQAIRNMPARLAHPLEVHSLLAKAREGGRLDLVEGVYLHENASLLHIGQAADARRKALHPDPVVTYIVDRNVNYTNICTARCKFCNFYRPPGSAEGYTLSKAQLAEKFRETEALGGTQILLQGGLNPELGLAYYEDLFRWAKANFNLNMHALSPTEVIHIARLEDLSIREVLVRLKEAGLGSLPGGGAEMLDDEVRNRISPSKNSTQEWLDVMREAHAVGLCSTATMVFGFQETSEQILFHLDRLRALQDQTGGFTAFIVWPFQAEGTRLKLRDDTSAHRYLRIQALARLYLDNIPNIQVSWPTLGPEVGEIALRFGANDFGSVMIEENVVSKAGAHFMLTAEEIEQHIRHAGFRPARRNVRYELDPVKEAR
jgi:cyclic dehypoxanthinyl futalosine synthase